MTRGAHPIRLAVFISIEPEFICHMQYEIWHMKYDYFIATPFPVSRTVAACSTFLLFWSCTKATTERLLELISCFLSLKVKASSRSLLREASKSSVFFFSAAAMAATSKLALMV